MESHTFGSTLRELVTDLRQSRDLIHQLTLRDIRIRYKQAIMGLGWAVLMPVLVVCSGLIVRYAMATLAGRALQFEVAATMAVKSLPWAFFVGATGFAVTSLTTNGHLIGKIYFPREVLPLSAVLAQVFDTGIGCIAVGLALPFLGVTPSWTMLWVPLLALMLVAFTTGIGFLLSMANLFFRDVKYIVQVILTFGIFFTPVLFEPQMLGGLGARLIMLNPLAPILEGLRLSVVEGHDLLAPLTAVVNGKTIVVWEPWYLGVTGLWCTVGLLWFSILFHRAQYRFAEMT